MQTDELIARLGMQVRALPRHAAIKRLCTALILGGMTAFGLLALTLGLRPDFVPAAATLPFWMKWMFTLSLVWAGVVVVRRLGNPDGRVGPAWWGLVAPFGVVAMMAIGELVAAPGPDRLGLVVGHTASQCSLAILSLSAPVFVALLLTFRRLAPTRLRWAGAMVGVLSGAAGASVYAFTCPETSAAFMITWYSAGILAAGVLGAAIGPRFLRW